VPFGASCEGHKDADEEKPSDDHPFERSVVMVGVETGKRFDPVSPEQSENGEKPTQRSETYFDPEAYPNGRLHATPLSGRNDGGLTDRPG
jgi:hypothetical protein